MKEGIIKEYYEKKARDYDRQFYLKQDEYPTLRYRHNDILEMV